MKTKQINPEKTSQKNLFNSPALQLGEPSKLFFGQSWEFGPTGHHISRQLQGKSDLDNFNKNLQCIVGPNSQRWPKNNFEGLFIVQVFSKYYF